MGILSQRQSGTTAVDDNAVGDKAWDSGTESKALASDGNDATIDLTPSKTSHYLKITNFPFQIPKNATIKGIRVNITKWQEAPDDGHDNVVKLVKAGIVQSENKAAFPAWQEDPLEYFYGSNNDLWSTTWTRGDVVDEGFGVVLSVTGSDGAMHVDNIDITIFYEIPSPLGIGISQKDINIFEATALQKVFSTDINTLKIYSKALVTITTDGSGIGSVTIPHNFGYAPTFFVFRKGTASWQRNNAGSIDSGSYPNAYFPNAGEKNNWINQPEIQYTSDEDNFYISIIGANSTAYNFVYFIMADLAEEYDSDSPNGTHHFGIKMGQPGHSVLNKKDFQLAWSTRFRAMEYIAQKSGSVQISLPELFGQQVSDTAPEEAVYADINHGLGYPPFFLAFVDFGFGSMQEIPTEAFSALIDLGLGGLNQTIDSWCDATRIRFSFWRKAYFESDDFWSQTTITIRYLIFKEDLTDFS